MAAIALVATPARGDDKAIARSHYIKGTKFYDLGHFDEAIQEYELAYQAKDDPVLLYNIAQSHRLAKHSSQALFYYKSYLRKLPDASNRREVEFKISELSKLLEQESRTQTLPPDHTLQPKAESASASERTPTAPAPAVPEPAPTPPPPASASEPPAAGASEATDRAAPPSEARPGRSKRIAGLVVAGVGVAALVGGLVASLQAQSASDDVSAAASSGGSFDPARESAGKTDQLIGGIMYGIGGVAVVAGVVVAILGFREGKRARSTSAARLTPLLSHGTSGAALSLEF